jgi:hypothetical protein
MPFSDFRLMALALVVIAGCALATTLRAFGFYRWARFRYADAKAWLFDKPEDDMDVIASPDVLDYAKGFYDPKPPTRPVPPENIMISTGLGRPRRKRRSKKDA